MGKDFILFDKIRFDGSFCSDTCPFFEERIKICTLFDKKIYKVSWFSFSRCSECIKICEIYQVAGKEA